MPPSIGDFGHEEKEILIKLATKYSGLTYPTKCKMNFADTNDFTPSYNPSTKIQTFEFDSIFEVDCGPKSTYKICGPYKITFRRGAFYECTEDNQCAKNLNSKIKCKDYTPTSGMKQGMHTYLNPNMKKDFDSYDTNFLLSIWYSTDSLIQLNTTQYDFLYLQAEATEFSGLYDQYPNCKIDLKKYIDFERHIIPQGYGYSFDADYEIKCGAKPTEHYLCENFEFNQEFPDPDCPKSKPRKGIIFILVFLITDLIMLVYQHV